MPRSKKSIWDSFTANHVDGVKRAKCKACAGDVVNNPARMKKHLAKCQPVVINVDEQTASSSVQGPPAKVLKQSTLQVLSTSAVKQHEIDLSVTRYFIATNTPFNAASNRHLKSLVQKLRPGTTIPERRKISGELLDEVYDQEKQKVKQQVQKAHVTLAIDGWSTLTNDPVLRISFYKSGVCYLVNTINTSGEPHTSDYLVQVVKDQIAYVEDEFGVKVTSFVTDNAANMNLMRREISHRHHGNMLTPLETAKAVEYIKEVAGEEMLPELTKYMGKTSPYTEYLFGEGYKKVEPSAWWSSGSKLGFDQNFIDFAKTLVDAVASSAGLERCFSTLGFTYGKLRASMGVEKAGKLACLFKQLNK